MNNLKEKLSSQYNIKVIIILILIILLFGGIIYHIININNIKSTIVEQKINEIESITPLILNKQNELTVTMEKLETAEENINIIKEEIKKLKMDTMSFDDAIILIKEKRHEMDSISVNDMLKY